LPEKDVPTLIKCQYFAKKQDENISIDSFFERKIEIYLHQCDGEKKDSLEGKKEQDGVLPLLHLPVCEEHAVDGLVERELQEEVAEEAAEEQSHQMIVCYQKGIGLMVGSIDEDVDGEQQAGQDNQKELEVHLGPGDARIMGIARWQHEVLQSLIEEAADMRHGDHQDNETNEQQRGEEVVAPDGIGHGLACLTLTVIAFGGAEECVIVKVVF